MIETPKIIIPGSTKEYPIGVALAKMAANDGCDGEPYDQMQMAANYIDSLETRLEAIERICTCDDIAVVQKDDETPSEPQICHFDKICQNQIKFLPFKGNKISKFCPNTQKCFEYPPLDAAELPYRDEYYASKALVLYGIVMCVRCNGRLNMDVATKTNRCEHCGQKYDRR